MGIPDQFHIGIQLVCLKQRVNRFLCFGKIRFFIAAESKDPVRVHSHSV